ncbi:FAD-binding oxidoreductase [Lentzea sp. NPDC042327]|uniref:FAD-binding oxidoreductase n=1 Tax=Lentzea sp. NPDC042327 TaxID=3154801 RepID=UPI0033EEB932
MSWENKPVMIDEAHRLRTVAEVEAVVGRPASMIVLKQVGALDEGCAAVLARSPIAGFGHRAADGTSRTAVVGGRPGFARLLSPTRLTFALDGTAAGPASLVFLLPGVGETLRVNGIASGTGEVVFDVEQVYVHCAQSVLRSGLWQPPVPAGPAAAQVGEGPLAAPGVADFLAAAPFLALSTWDSKGGADTSPRGEAGPVARVLDGHTLVIADRRGNRRADTLHNLLEDDRLSFAALVPGRTGVLHGRGRAVITVDPAVLEPLALKGVPPHAALLVHVEAAELSTSDAVTRARLWTSAPVDDTPDLIALASGHLTANTASRPRRALLRVAGLVPARWLRPVLDLAYRSGLRKEGYAIAPAGTAAPAPDPLREVGVVEVRAETPCAVTVVLADGAPFDFRPGQFFTLVADLDGEQVRRPYSASSAPGTTRLELTVKRVAGGRFSAHVHERLAVGDRVAVRGPSGSFRLVQGHEVVAITAGSGITPVMSMVRALLAEPAGPRIALLHCDRSEEEAIFAAELAELGERHPGRLAVTHVVTARAGRLDGPGVRRWVGSLAPSPDARYYLCGPEAFMDVVRQALDVPPEHVHQERYTSGPVRAPGSATPQRVVVEGLGTAVAEPGQTLLDAGLAAGLPLPYSCTVGSCGECVAQLVGGEVSRQETGCLTAEQKATGRVLTCTSAPLTDVTLRIGR